MELVLRRRPSTRRGTVGELYANGHFCCYTMEDPVRERDGVPVSMWKIPKETAIPHGRYRVVVTLSDRFKRELPLLLDVKGFTGIRIHPGNTAANTEGCILPGAEVAPDESAVLHSRDAFDELFAMIRQALADDEEVWIDVRNADVTV